MGSDLVCPYEKCGKEFKQPVLLTDEAVPTHETYYACPHCHTKVDLVLQDAENFRTVKVVASVDADMHISRTEKPENCSHYVGYLQTMPENASLPEGCLTCPKVMVCFARH